MNGQTHLEFLGGFVIVKRDSKETPGEAKREPGEDVIILHKITKYALILDSALYTFIHRHKAAKRCFVSMYKKNGSAITVTLIDITRSCSPQARMYPEKIFWAVNRFSDGDWGFVPEKVQRDNEDFLNQNEPELELFGLYQDLALCGLTRRPQLPSLRIEVLNPIVLTVTEAQKDPRFRHLFATTEKVVEFALATV